MTAEELEQLVLDGKDGWDVQRAAEKLDEAERTKLSTAAQKLQDQLHRCKANAQASPRLRKLIGKRGRDTWKYWHAPENRNAVLALYALAPVSALKKRDLFVNYEDAAVIERIIADRRPEWIDDWIAHELEKDFTQLRFPTIRAWIRDGVCRKPAVDGYYRMFSAHLMRTKELGEHVPPISKQLLADPGLLDDIEGLFRVENIAFNTNEWLTRGAGEDHETWPEALVKLAAEGHVERARLLDLALDGLATDLKQNQLSGFHGFYKRMAPGPDELAAHQQRFIALLCHPVGHVAKFAIEMLGEIEKQGKLDVAPVVSEIQAVFAADGKGNAVAALKLLKRILARSKGDDPAALLAVSEALRHGHADVQSQALDILEANNEKLGAAHFDAIAGAEGFVAASNRGRLAKLSAGSAALANAEPAAVPTAPAPAAEPSSYVVMSDDINAQRILFDEDRIQPISSIDELIEALLHAVEVVDSPDEVERIVDAISRLGGDRSFDFDSKVAPLVHRIEAGGSHSGGLVIGYGGIGRALLDLILTWLKGKLHSSSDFGFSHHATEGGFQPLIEHLQAITVRISRRKPAALLSAPTHKGGWIDPRLWVERLGGMRGDKAPGAMDFRLSLLRLAPDHRGEALARVGDLDPSIARVARFALGGDELPRSGDRSHWANWITAARCRSPLKDWIGEFAPLKLHDQLPDGLVPARYHWRASSKIETYGRQSWKAPVFEVEIHCGDQPAEAAADGVLNRLGRTLAGQSTTDWTELPTAALNRQSGKKQQFFGETNVPWVAQWLSYIWPQNPSAAYIKAAIKLADRMDEDASSWEPRHGHFHALFQRNRPWLEPGHLLLAIGLSAKDADVRGLAVDALIEGIGERRFDPERFASVMARLVEGEWIKLGRLGDALMQAVPVSDLHATVIGDALLQWLPRLDFKQKNSFRLLEVLVETQAIAGRPLDEPARAALMSCTGSGKAAKLARQLLAA